MTNHTKRMKTKISTVKNYNKRKSNFRRRKLISINCSVKEIILMKFQTKIKT